VQSKFLLTNRENVPEVHPFRDGHQSAIDPAVVAIKQHHCQNHQNRRQNEGQVSQQTKPALPRKVIVC